MLHYLPLDDETCKARVRLRNETQPPGLFFGEVTEAQVEEVNSLVSPPLSSEGFKVVTLDQHESPLHRGHNRRKLSSRSEMRKRLRTAEYTRLMAPGKNLEGRLDAWTRLRRPCGRLTHRR